MSTPPPLPRQNGLQKATLKNPNKYALPHSPTLLKPPGGGVYATPLGGGGERAIAHTLLTNKPTNSLWENVKT